MENIAIQTINLAIQTKNGDDETIECKIKTLSEDLVGVIMGVDQTGVIYTDGKNIHMIPWHWVSKLTLLETDDAK